MAYTFQIVFFKLLFLPESSFNKLLNPMLYTNMDLYTRFTYSGLIPWDNKEFLSKLIFFRAAFSIDLSKCSSLQYSTRIWLSQFYIALSFIGPDLWNLFSSYLYLLRPTSSYSKIRLLSTWEGFLICLV